ncbi:MAG: hypothetical protein H6R07_1006 [Proteobacteria bacterium]|nr:hypothetical protein [Pseudomonadota bacterium]
MSETKDAEDNLAPGKATLMQRLRLPLMIGGMVVGLLVFLLIGFGLGKAKQALERRQVAEQILQLKTRMAAIEDQKKLFEVKAEGLAQVIEKQKRQIEELEHKLEVENAALALKASEVESIQAAIPPQKAAPAKVAASAPKPREYARFGNEECTLLAGKGNESWKACLQGRTKASPEADSARVAKGAGKQEQVSQKTASPVHSAH